MEIRLEGDGVNEEQVREIMKEQHIFLMGPDGKKQSFEVVSMITLEKKVYVVASKEGAPGGRLIMFDVVIVDGQLRFNIVRDVATIKKVNDKINGLLTTMDKKGMIPPVN